MRKHILTLVSALILSLLVSGCAGSSPWMNANIAKKEDGRQEMHINIARAPRLKPELYVYKGYKVPQNISYQCANAYMIHAISTKALEKGYNYFTLTFEAGSTKRPLPINSVGKYLRYCNAPYYDKKTDLLEDKCSHIGLGRGYPGVMRNVTALFSKQRNSFVPMWNASQAKKEALAELQNNCYKENPKMLSDLLAEYSKIQEK